MLGIEKVKIDQSLLVRACEVDAFKGLWAGLERHTTALHLLGDFSDYGARFAAMLTPLKERPFDVALVRQIHALTAGQGKAAIKQGAELRDSPLLLSPPHYESVANQGDFETLETAAPEDVEALLNKLLAWAGPALDKPMSIHPLFVMAVFAAVFLQIAPFESGNWRTLRFVLMLMQIKAGYVYAPYAVFDGPMNTRGQDLFDALKSNQKSLEAGRPDWTQWLLVFFDLLHDQRDVLLERLYKKGGQMATLPALSNRILDLFRSHPRLQMKQIVKLTNGRRATIKLRLGELVESGYLRRHGQARATWYALV